MANGISPLQMTVQIQFYLNIDELVHSKANILMPTECPNSTFFVP